MTAALVIDDHLLLRVLLDDEPPSLRPRGAELFTTGLWYHRLSRALSDETVVGVMSASLVAVTEELAQAAIASVLELPEPIGLLSLRTLAWPMAELATRGARLNLLSLEALAAADHLDAALCLASINGNQPLRQHAEQHRVPVRLISD